MPPRDGEGCCTSQYRADTMRRADSRIKSLASAVQGFSLDLAEIADAVGLDKNECLEPPAVVHAVKQMAARLKAYEPQPTLPQS